MDRLSHVWLGAILSGAFLVLSVHAFYIYKDRYKAISMRAFKIALLVAVVFSLAQLFTGHRSADGVAKNQPAKLAAMEGHFKAEAPADMYLVGWVDKENQEVIGLKIPNGLSFMIHQDFDAPVTGLERLSLEDRPVTS